MNEIENIIENVVEKKFSQLVNELRKESRKREERRYVYNLKDLASYLGCSKATVSRWKAEGKFRGCFKQLDSTLIFDLDKIDTKFAC